MKKLFLSILILLPLTSCNFEKNLIEPENIVSSSNSEIIDDTEEKIDSIDLSSDKIEDSVKEETKVTELEDIEEVVVEDENEIEVLEEDLEEPILIIEEEPITIVEINDAPKVSEVLGVSSELDNTKKSWYFGRNKNQQRPSAQNEIDLRLYNGFYLGEDERSIYLTFDEGYENGYTEKILDVLKEKNVKAAFFVTEPYITSNVELMKRMVNEGHIVGNHSSTHPSFPSQSDEEIIDELNKTAKTFKEVTGVEMNSYFRPPMGEYSERVLDVVNQMGYKTIFWSLAYKDWLVDEQPTTEEAIYQGTFYAHNGCIMLLHAVSKANTDALPDIIDNLRKSGYTFKTLDNL